MCTAVSYSGANHYFGRTLDHYESYMEEVAVVPRRFPLPGISSICMHYAMIGMAHVADGIPLLYDGVNEKGLAMAGLNFVGYAKYAQPDASAVNIPAYALISYVLGTCASVAEAMRALKTIRITNENFSPTLVSPQLHWLMADSQSSVVVEICEDGLHLHKNPVGVLTNNPPFPQQLLNLSNYMHLTEKEPVCRFPGLTNPFIYSNGMGGIGLPGDFSSQARFVRAAFLCGCAGKKATEIGDVTQFFHILDSVAQVDGSCHLPNGKWEKTIYSSCCDCNRGIYYYTGYSNRQISCVSLHRCDLEQRRLFRYPMELSQQVRSQN